MLSRARSGGASSVPAPPRGLTLRSGASAAPTCAQDPAAPARTQMLQLSAGRIMGRPRCARGAAGGGGSTHPALPVGRRSPPPARQALQPPAAAPAAQLCSAPGNLLFRARACKIGQTGWEEERLKENGTGPFKICRFLFLWSLRPFPSARTKAQGEERGKETSTPSKGRHGTGEVKRKGSLDDNLYFPVCGGCDVLETEIRRKDSALPSLRVPETHG